MPELPDVQVLKEYVDATALHRRIASVSMRPDGMLDGVSRRVLGSRLRGRKLESTRRHGKHLFVQLTEDGWLHLHFGMTGDLAYYKAAGDEPDDVRLRLTFSNGYHLVYCSTRKLGKIGLVRDVDEYIEDAHLGPDPLENGFDLARFRDALEGRSGTIKATLMNQEVLAGIGNVYADETLFRAGVHPATQTDRLSDDAVKRIYRALRDVIGKAIEARGEVERFPRSYLLPHRLTDGRCPRCDCELKHIKVSGRTTYFCPKHQRKRV